MRTLLIALAGALLLAGCSSAPEPATDPAAAAGSTVVFEVFGMDCPGCHGGLEKLALGIPGVTAARASWEDKSLTLTVADDAEVADDQVVDVISRANFTAGERLK